MKQTRTIAGAALAVLLMVPLTASRMTAQPQSDIKDADLGDAIKVDVDVVSLYCTVHNKQNGLIGSLQKGDFDLAEDAKPQTIKYFSKETDIPLTMGLLIDVSGSQANM